MRFLKGYGLKAICLLLTVFLVSWGCSSQQQQAEEGVESSQEDSQSASSQEGGEDEAGMDSGLGEGNTIQENLDDVAISENNQSSDLTNAGGDTGANTFDQNGDGLGNLGGGMAQAGNQGPALSANATNPTTLPTSGNVGGDLPMAPAGGGMIMGTAGIAAASALPEMGSKMAYIVAKGDTLGKISQAIYGTPKHWKDIAKWSGIVDPNLIYPGEVIYYQLTEASLAFASTYEGMNKIELTVQEGETVGDIAKKVYGSSNDWQLVWRQNGELGSPDQLKKGMKLYFKVDSQTQLANQLKAQTGLNKLQTVDENGSFDMNRLIKQLKNVEFKA